MNDARPELHITPPRGWLNDPNGLIVWNGRQHLFHQSDSDSYWFGTMSWGHLVSDDLLTWRRFEDALVPSQPSDADGCWTGCIVDNGGVPTAIYTGVISLGNDQWTQTVCMATAGDADLREWTKYAANPLRVEPPGFETAAFRDPFVWQHDGGWVMILGTSLPSGTGAVVLYRSDDLLDWRYEGILLDGDRLPHGSPWTGSVWECPSLHSLDDDTWLLIFSVADPAASPILNYSVAVTGSFDAGRFQATSARRLDYGTDFYAPAVERHPDGRILAYGWSWEALDGAEREDQGWAGAITFPREILWNGESVSARPISEVDSAVGIERSWSGVAVAPGIPTQCLIRSPVARIELELDLEDQAEVAIAVYSTADQSEDTTIRLHGGAGHLEFDRRSASQRPGAARDVTKAPCAAKHIHLVLWLDHSIIELFEASGTSMTQRVYPHEYSDRYFRINVVKGLAVVDQLKVREVQVR